MHELIFFCTSIEINNFSQFCYFEVCFCTAYLGIAYNEVILFVINFPNIHLQD